METKLIVVISFLMVPTFNRVIKYYTRLLWFKRTEMIELVKKIDLIKGTAAVKV